MLIVPAFAVFPWYFAVASWSVVCGAPQGCHWWRHALSTSSVQAHVAREVGAAGFMLFDFGAFNKEKFIVESTLELLSYGPSEVLGLEWQPEDGRAVRYLKPPAPGRLKEYCFAGKGYSSTELEKFSMQTFDDVPISFLDWAPGVGSLGLEDNTVDIVFISAYAIDALKPKGLRLALKESARVLKATGQLMLYREEDEGGKKPLPEIVQALYTVNATRSEGSLVLRQLLPKPKSSSRVRPKPIARAAAGAGVRSASASRRGNKRRLRLPGS